MNVIAAVYPGRVREFIDETRIPFDWAAGLVARRVRDRARDQRMAYGVFRPAERSALTRVAAVGRSAHRATNVRDVRRTCRRGDVNPPPSRTLQQCHHRRFGSRCTRKWRDILRADAPKSSTMTDVQSSVGYLSADCRLLRAASPIEFCDAVLVAELRIRGHSEAVLRRTPARSEHRLRRLLLLGHNSGRKPTEVVHTRFAAIRASPTSWAALVLGVGWCVRAVIE